MRRAGSADTLFLGSGVFAVPILERLASHPSAHLVGAVTAPPRPAGRHREPRVTPVATLAGELGVPVLAPERLRDADATGAIARLRPALIVLADYGRLVPQAILDLPEHGALNLHPSLLPRHRGASPVPAAILAGDRETGVTLMLMDSGIDTGPIVAQRRFVLRGDELAPQLQQALAREAAELLADALEDWLAGRLIPHPQPEVGATLTRPLRREDGRLDATLPAAVLERQVRAYQPWPGSWLEVPAGMPGEGGSGGRAAGTERLLVWRARVVHVAESAAGPVPPGALVPWQAGIALGTPDGLLALDEVQPGGGRRMSGADLKRGRAWLTPRGTGGGLRGGWPHGTVSGEPG